MSYCAACRDAVDEGVIPVGMVELCSGHCDEAGGVQYRCAACEHVVLICHGTMLDCGVRLSCPMCRHETVIIFEAVELIIGGA